MAETLRANPPVPPPSVQGDGTFPEAPPAVPKGKGKGVGPLAPPLPKGKGKDAARAKAKARAKASLSSWKPPTIPRSDFLADVRRAGNRRKMGQVLTLRCVAKGPHDLTVVSTTMGGVEKASVTVAVTDTLAMLHRAVVAAAGVQDLLSPDGGETHLRMVLPNGTFLNDLCEDATLESLDVFKTADVPKAGGA